MSSQRKATARRFWILVWENTYTHTNTHTESTEQMRFSMRLQHYNKDHPNSCVLFTAYSDPRLTMRLFGLLLHEPWLPGWRRYANLLGYPLHPSLITDDYCSASAAVTKAAAGWAMSQQAGRSWPVSHQSSGLQEATASSCTGHSNGLGVALCHAATLHWRCTNRIAGTDWGHNISEEGKQVESTMHLYHPALLKDGPKQQEWQRWRATEMLS